MFFYPEENTGVIVLTNGEASYALSAMVAHLFEYAGGPSGIIAGIVTDQDSNPIDNVYVKTIGFTRLDYSNPDGEYTIGGLIDGTYDVRFRHSGYAEIIVENVTVALGETTFVNITMQAPCEYLAGDCNHNGIPLELGDVIAMIGMYRGAVAPPYECSCPPHGDNFAPTADPDGNCVALELGDVVTEIAAYRGSGTVSGCEDCPGSLRLLPDDRERLPVVPSLKSKMKIGKSSVLE